MSQLKIKQGNTWVGIPAGGVGVPSGGNEGDVLVKSSDDDYATEWATLKKTRAVTKMRTFTWTPSSNVTISGHNFTDVTLTGQKWSVSDATKRCLIAQWLNTLSVFVANQWNASDGTIKISLYNASSSGVTIASGGAWRFTEIWEETEEAYD